MEHHSSRFSPSRMQMVATNNPALHGRLVWFTAYYCYCTYDLMYQNNKKNQKKLGRGSLPRKILLAIRPWASRAFIVIFWLESKTSGCPCLALMCDVIKVSSTMASPFNWIPLGVIFMLPIPSCCSRCPSRQKFLRHEQQVIFFFPTNEKEILEKAISWSIMFVTRLKLAKQLKPISCLVIVWHFPIYFTTLDWGNSLVNGKGRLWL